MATPTAVPLKSGRRAPAAVQMKLGVAPRHVRYLRESAEALQISESEFLRRIIDQHMADDGQKKALEFRRARRPRRSRMAA